MPPPARPFDELLRSVLAARPIWLTGRTQICPLVMMWTALLPATAHCRGLAGGRTQMGRGVTIGLDVAKSVFQGVVHITAGGSGRNPTPWLLARLPPHRRGARSRIIC